MAAIATGVSAATSAARARIPGSTVTIVRSSPTGITTVSGVRLVRKPATATPSFSRLAAHVLAAEVATERGDERRLEAEPGGGDRRDGAAARRAHQLAGEALLAGSGQAFEPDEGEVEEGRGGDREFDAQHGGEGIR